jgi:DNA polymerase III subunit epsilon
MRQIVLDTETTGLSAENGDRIIEIGCVELLNRRLTGNNLHFYLNPERDSHEEAIKVHGISNAFLRDKPKFAEIADELLSYLQEAEVIIHNAPFDLSFLDDELSRIGRSGLDTIVANVVDTLAMAKEMFPGKRNSLDALCSRLEVDNGARTLHGALLDAQLLADVYMAMTRGQEALLIDHQDQPNVDGNLAAIDLRSVPLLVLNANAQELLAHEAVLDGMSKGCKAIIWRNPPEAVA